MKLYNINFWTRLSLDIIYIGVDDIPKIGEEMQAQSVDFQLGGGITTYALLLNRFGIKNQLHFYSNSNNTFSNMAIDQLKSNNFSNYIEYPVNFVPVDITSVISTNVDRSFVSFAEKKSSVINYNRWKKIMSDSDIIFLNHEITHEFLSEEFSNKIIFYSVGYNEAQNIEMAKKCIAVADYFVPNEIEAEIIFNNANLVEVLDILESLVKIPVISLGSRGCIVKEENKYYNYYIKTPVNFVDATGAGDNFYAGMIYSVINEFSVEKTIKFAMACGSLSVQGIGAHGNEYLLDQVFESFENIGIKEITNMTDLKDFTSK